MKYFTTEEIYHLNDIFDKYPEDEWEERILELIRIYLIARKLIQIPEIVTKSLIDWSE